MLYVQYASTKRTQGTIKHHGNKLWNSLCNSIPTDCAISAYKQKLKLFLGMTFSIVVSYYCYCYIIIIFFIFLVPLHCYYHCYHYIIIIVIVIVVVTVIIIVIIVIDIIIIIIINTIIILSLSFSLLLLLLLLSDCYPPCTFHSVPAHLILYIPAIYMNLGHISPYFSAHCQSCDCIVLIVLIDNCCPLCWIVYLRDWLIFFVQLWQ